MRFAKTTTLFAAAVAGSAFFVTGGANAAPPAVDSATGGGQILVENQNAGSTIAFTAKGTAAAGDGQVQYVDRTAGTGQSQAVSHGVVDCIDAQSNDEQGIAFIEGTWTNGVLAGERFKLYVEDNGEGAAAMGSDIVTLLDGDDTPECDFDAPADDAQIELGRGNVQVRDGV